jgi:hypothetical protein
MYSVKTKNIQNKPGTWDSLEVSIFKDEKFIGKYLRVYSTLYNTFVPFKQDGKDFALYSADYTCTSVMSLPDCKQIATEKGDTFGFCPTGYYVPDKDDYGNDLKINGQFGFVCGCVWGDDNSWKIQYLDLSKIQEGKIHRDDRMGYIELLGSENKLKDAIDFDWYDPDDEDGYRLVRISCARTFNLNKNEND